MSTTDMAIIHRAGPARILSLEEVGMFLRAQNSRGIVHLMRSLTEPAHQVAVAATLMSMSANGPNASATPEAAPDNVEKAEKAKKVMNAFVGFRCYYITIPAFKPWPMKLLSNLASQLWEQEPNKPLWTLMTTAWSTMRDQIGKENVPLRPFFEIICPHLGMTSPDTYLEEYGWTLDINEAGLPVLSRDPANLSPASSAAEFDDLTLSVEDITSVCQTMGYAQGYVSDPNSASQTFLGRSQTQQQATENQVVASRTKKVAATVPRPLNRWVIFRDAEYKRLKTENPNLTVQQISKLCSKKWAAVPEEVKMTVWEDKAVAARAEHKRMYPNYRYAPRKAGEKKKRQSRKAKHTAAAAVRQQSLDITQSSGTPTMTIEDNFVFEDAFGLDNTTTSQASMANDWAPMVNSPFSSSPAVDGLHAETLRHERLQVEVGAELGFADSFGLFGDETFAFRDGADGSATLPSIFSEGF